MTGNRYGGGRPSANAALAATLVNDVVDTGRASANQIAKMFHIDKNNIGRRLSTLTPVSHRAGVAYYDIMEAATVLVPPSPEQIEEKMRRMNRADLPAGLTSEFWSGQKARLAFEREQGDHWPTDDVIAVFAEASAEIHMQLKLMRDRVERETSLTPQQRSIIDRNVEACINGIREALVSKFENRAPPNDNIAGERPGDEL